MLERELPEQILADGGQFERSPMYHALALEDVLDLLNAIATLGSHRFASAPLRQRIARARSCDAATGLRCMTHPDGTLARFNDSTDGIAPAHEDLERLGSGARHCRAACRRRWGTGCSPAAMCASCGASSWRCSTSRPSVPTTYPAMRTPTRCRSSLRSAGAKLVVNGGTSVYGTGARRCSSARTAAHSTVSWTGTDSSEVWSGFRVGRRARPAGQREPSTMARCAAPRRLRPSARSAGHHRRWQFEPNRPDGVEDRSAARARRSAHSHASTSHPVSCAAPIGDHRWRCRDAAGQTLAIAMSRPVMRRIEASHHAARFGRSSSRRTP